MATTQTFRTLSERLPSGTLYLNISVPRASSYFNVQDLRIIDIDELTVGTENDFDSDHSASNVTIHVFCKTQSLMMSMLESFSNNIAIVSFMFDRLNSGNYSSIMDFNIDRANVSVSKFYAYTLDIDCVDELAGMFGMSTNVLDRGDVDDHYNYLEMIKILLNGWQPGLLNSDIQLDNRIRLQIAMATSPSFNAILLDDSAWPSVTHQIRIPTYYVLSPDAYFPTRGEALNAMLANICGSGFYFPGKSYKILPLYDDLSPRLHISDYDVVGVKALPSIDNYAAQSWDTNHEYADAATWDSRDQQTYNFLLKSGASVQSTINIPFACDSRTELDGYPGANPPYGSTISSFSPNFPTPSYQFLSLANSAIYYNYRAPL